MKFTEAQLQSYTAPLSETEEQKCKNALRMVRDAMKLVGYTDDGKEIRTYETDTYSFALDLRGDSGKNITLLVQGSYANNTNVRTYSDVDVAVILESTFIPEYRPGVTGKDYNFSDGTFSAEELKDEVERALKIKFNDDGVERKDKSIKVHGNTYRVDSDIVPAYRFRDYRKEFDFNDRNFIGGIQIRPDSGGRIVNYPEQHIKNGRTKNVNTNHYFKKNVRIIKKIRYIMQDNGYTSANNVASFGLESLLWNIPNETFMKYVSYRFTFDEIIQYIISDTNNLSSYKEANGIKPLFPKQVDIENYKDFINDLSKFYEYDITES